MSEQSGSASTAPDLEPNGTILMLGRLLSESGLRHALIGGQALNAWAKSRGTDDYDLCVAADREAIARFEARLRQQEVLPVQRQDDGAMSGPDFVRLANRTSTILVDIQTAKTEYQQLVIERAVPTPAGVSVATPEDLVILKLLAFRGQDQRDIVLLLRWNYLDLPYIRQWAEAWEVSSRLAILTGSIDRADP